MKLATYTHNGITRLGAVSGDGLIDLNAAAAQGEISLGLAQVKLESPVPNPPRIFAVALNYMDHYHEIPEAVREAHKVKPPEIPVIFNKQTTSTNGPYDAIHLPAESPQLDYEAELGIVIGKTCRRVPREKVFDVIAGYTVLNDVTIRDWQLATPTMTMGKSWDTHCPMGPVMVTTDEIADPENLNVVASVDGEVRQNFNTRDMIFGIADQIVHLSTAFTLLPGDVIATGTSAGVALFREGQPYLKEGQKVRVEVDQIGYIENTVALESDPAFIR